MRSYIVLAALSLILSRSALGADYIVRDGKPNAQIVIAAKPQRTTALAAQELRRGIKVITGAELPIVREPSDEVSVHIYVGESPYTEKLGITADDRTHGAYRIVTGKNWLVLIGDDSNWDPPYEPSQNEYRNHCTDHRVTSSEEFADFDVETPVDVWRFDERGSFNAVCGFLRSLGVRWYMPGELGEVAPELSTIALPEMDEAVRPALSLLRAMHYAKWNGNRDIAMWLMRLGDRKPAGFGIAHGMVQITRDEELERKHPEYYAQYGNKPRQGPHSCFSSPGLFKETVKHVRRLFDERGQQSVSIMPADAYTTMCQCELCEGKDTPERGSTGRTSDHVWDFVNRVAKEIAKTHPDKTVNCMAYGSYWQPPLKIDKLHPNVLVGIVHGRRPREDKPEEQKRIRENREAWMEKTDNKILIFENYPMGGWFLPWFVPHVIADTINQTKGESLGESIWTTLVGRNAQPGFYHFPVYFTMRMYWGDANQDVGPMLDEYYAKFYGPAEKEMRAFFEYCEDNWREAGKEREKADRVLELIAAAGQKVDTASAYGRRIALVDQFLDRLRKRLDTIGVEPKRDNVPELVLHKAEGDIELDGKLDDDMWQNVPESSGGKLKELREGGMPEFGTEFKAAWAGDGIYFAIRCEEDREAELTLGGTAQDDPAVHYGDNVEILLETPSHAYYQMTVNPAGAIVDLDRSEGLNWDWDAQAEVATSQGKGYWTVEMFVPVFESAIDPNHQVVGKQPPSKEAPWYFNVCRQRVREEKTELSAFSPTLTRGFHVRDKFARMVGTE